MGVQPAFFKESFPSDFEAMSQTLDRTVAALRGRGYVSDVNEACTRLCLEEALVNAVRHGNKCDASRTVTVELEDRGDACTIFVCDEGDGFSPDALQMPDTEALSGRGVCLIRHFMQNVCYNKARNCLEMHLSRRTTKTNGD